MSTCGEHPLDSSEMDALVQAVDPHGAGRIPLSRFLALECWEAPSVDTLVSLRGPGYTPAHIDDGSDVRALE